MVKSELIRALNEKLPDSQLDNMELIVNCLLKHMSDGLVQGERIEIRGFCSAEIKRVIGHGDIKFHRFESC